MTVYIFYSILSLLPILWITSIVWLRKWKPVLLYALLNAVAIFLYLFVLFFTSIKLFEHDEYGLKKVFLFLFILSFHTVAGFIFALYFKFKLSKNAN
jgi:hypothetical protein